MLGLHSHELWRDELQIWLIGTHSNNIAEFWSNRSLESDSFLWHFIVYIFTRFTDNIYFLQLLNIAVSVVSAYFILTKSPFSIIKKILLIFGYYMLFEFSLITRSYSLGILLMILLLNSYYGKKHLLMMFFLLLLANTNLLMAIVGFSLLIYFYLSKTVKRGYLLIAAFGVFLSISDVFWQTYMNWNFSLAESQEVDLLWFFWYKASLIFKSFFIIPDFARASWWNTNVFEGHSNLNYVNILMGILSIGLLGSFFKIFKTDKFLLFGFAVGIGLMLILFVFFWGGSQRHWGHFFILFLAFYWLLKNNTLFNSSILFERLFTLILGLQCVVGVVSFTKEINQDFSNSREVADYIEAKSGGKMVIAGYPDFTITPVSYHLGMDFYSFQSRRMESFIDWNRIEKIGYKDIIKQINHLKNDSESLFVILSNTYNEELVKHIIASDEIEIISKRSFNDAIEIYENYSVLEIGNINKKTLSQ